jgi:excisionase family DNA binding protein
MGTRMADTGTVSAERFLTLREAAEILRLHPRTVRDYVRRGELAGRIVLRRWRFRRTDLDAFLHAPPVEWEFFGGNHKHGE